MKKHNTWIGIEAVIIGLLLLVLLFLKQCESNVEVVNPVSRVVYTKTDTVTIIKRDTITRYVTLKVPVPIPHVTPDGDTLQTYVQEYSDSILDATLTAKLKGKLDSWDFKYKAKIPITITNTVTVTNTIKETKEVNVPKNMLFVNGVFVGNMNNIDGGLGISFYHKKGYIYQLNYLPLSRGIIAGISFQLNR
jgi:hypothetical protein